jgi:hypothetical protein
MIFQGHYLNLIAINAAVKNILRDIKLKQTRWRIIAKPIKVKGVIRCILTEDGPPPVNIILD